MDPAFVLELEEEAVAGSCRKLGLEADRFATAALMLAGAVLAAGRMCVQVGQVTLAQRHQVALRAEVVLYLD